PANINKKTDLLAQLTGHSPQKYGFCLCQKNRSASRRMGVDQKTATAPTQSVGGLKLRPAAQYLGGLSVPTMHRLTQRGLLRPNRALRHLIFPVAELDRFSARGHEQMKSQRLKESDATPAVSAQSLSRQKWRVRSRQLSG